MGTRLEDAAFTIVEKLLKNPALLLKVSHLLDKTIVADPWEGNFRWAQRTEACALVVQIDPEWEWTAVWGGGEATGRAPTRPQAMQAADAALLEKGWILA